MKLNGQHKLFVIFTGVINETMARVFDFDSRNHGLIVDTAVNLGAH